MKRLVCGMLACGILCALTGCGEETLPRPDFPLEQEVVLAAAEQAGLSWDLAEDETQASGENQILYTFRHPTETFGDTENKLVVAVVNSALDGDRRYLQMNFESVRVPEKPTFSWEDWKQQLMFAALLYGGFTDEEAVYQALSAQETPEVKVSEPLANSLHREALLWNGVALEGGYCVVNCRTGEVSTASTSEKWASTLSVTFYESQEHFEEMQAEAQRQKEVWVAMTPEEKQAQTELRFKNLVETYEVDTLSTMPEIVQLQEIVSPDCFVFSASGKGSESRETVLFSNLAIEPMRRGG